MNTETNSKRCSNLKKPVNRVAYNERWRTVIQQISRKTEKQLTSKFFYFLPFFLFASQKGLWAYMSVWPEIWLWHFSFFLLGCCLSRGMGRECCCLLFQLFSSISTVYFIGNCLEGTFEYLVANQWRNIRIIFLQIEGRKIHVGSEVKWKKCPAKCLQEILSRKLVKTTRKREVIMELIWEHRSAKEKYRWYNIRSQY